MKKLAIIAGLLIFSAGGLKASNYPADYSYQKVHVLLKGPALAATVGSGIMDQKLVIGYKKSGILGGFDKIFAVVKVTYYGGDGNMKVSERVLEIQKDWHGAGFLTPAMIHEDYITLVDGRGFRGIQRIELAFFSGSQWDSNYGANYVIEPNELATSNIQFASQESSSEVAIPCWNFITDQLGK
ncbi:MAG: hypothetical protein NTY45_10175 [Elusimicrobia bacterium]|nr:hypothetical protein [Elusimicrobiota bacterium]